jgi:hypothetical protein
MPHNVVYRKAFQEGVRRDSRGQHNADTLQLLYNLSPTDMGSVPVRTIAQPVSNAELLTALITKAYPWPQLFVGKSVTLLADEEDLFTVTKSDSSGWTLTALPVYDFTTYDWDADTASSGTITAGKDWHFVDNWTEWMLFNGSCVVFKTGFSSKVFVVDDVVIQTGATYNDGRIFYGGFTNPNALADWDSYLASLTGTVPAEEAKLQSNPLGTNWTWWSSIGKADYLRFFSLDYMKYASLASSPDTEFSSTDTFWQTLAKRRESGRAPMPWTGSVTKMMQLGEHMICYGTNGVQALSPINTENVKTFGQAEIIGLGAGVGARSGTKVRASVGGNESIHAMVDEAGDLWLIEPNGPRATNVGFRHIFEDKSNILVHYDAHENEFHFSCNGADAYRLKVEGLRMTSVEQVTTSLYFGRANDVSSPIGVYFLTGNTDSVFATEWFTGAEQNDPSSLSAVSRVTVVGSEGWTLTLLYKRYPGDQQRAVGPIATDNRNTVDFGNVKGVLFYIYGTHADPTTAKISELVVQMDVGNKFAADKLFNAALA